MNYTVNALAGLAGVSPRTIRHYDQVGLLRPAARSQAGYRLYDRQSLLRLQQILFYKELGFSLEQTSQMLDTPGFDYLTALENHKNELLKKAEYCKKLAALANDTILNLKGMKHMKNNELIESFDYDKMMEEQKKYEPEVIEKWGETDAYKISQKRTKNYTKEDWERISDEQNENLTMLVEAYKNGVPHDSEQAKAIVERSRLAIDKWFYPCAPEFMLCLGEMYISDPRFTEFYDKHAPGLAEYYNKAIAHHCGPQK